MFTRLKLPAIRDQPDSPLAEAARQELTLVETVVHLCAREIARKYEHCIAMALGLARFPIVHELAGYVFAAQPTVDKEQIRELATGHLITNGEAEMLLGPPVVGKAHLSVAIGRAAIIAGYSMLLDSAPALNALLVKANARGQREEKLGYYIKLELLCIEDPGYLPIEPDAAHVLI
jgi:DNA replication protein DnaC